MAGFLGLLAQGVDQSQQKKAKSKELQDARSFQAIKFGQERELAQSQIAENNARTESLKNPRPKWSVETRDDGTYLVNPETGEERKTTIPGNRDPVKTAVAVAQATKGIPTYGDLHPKPDQSIVPVQDPNGAGAVYATRADAIGKHAPSPNATGKAALMKDVAANQTQVSVIDDALKELNAHPDAVGLKRSAADLPLIGGAADAINQRVDEGGIAARASLANVSSLVIKDRSGSAVTISESARLRPFIPSTGDTPAAIRVKLAKLKAAIQTETRLLQEGMGQNAVTHSPAASGDIDLGVAKPSAVPSYEDWLKSKGHK